MAAWPPEGPDDLLERLSAAERALAAERAESGRLRSVLNGQRRRAEALESELARVYASHSWRLTQPLRFAVGRARQLRPYLHAQMADRNSWLRRAIRVVLEAGLALARAFPAVKPVIVRALSGFPKLDAQLRGFARARTDGVPRKVEGASVVPGRELPPLPVFRQESAAAGQKAAGEQKASRRPLGTGQRTLYFYVDHTVLCPVNTGMQRVTRGLARALRAAGERVCFVKWDYERAQLVLVNRGELVHLARWQGPQLEPAEIVQYPDASAPGMAVDTHALDEGHWLVVPEVTYINFHPEVAAVNVIVAARSHGLRSAFVFYDAIPLRRPELAASAAPHELYMQQLLLADLVVPISKWSGDDLSAFLRHREAVRFHPTPSIRVLPLPGESLLSERRTAGGEGGSSAPARRLVLSVGTIEPRKNQLSLVRAFEQFSTQPDAAGWELVLVGNIHETVASELDAARARNPSIRVMANLDDEALRDLYDAAAFTVFPSVEEGFGLPILESLWHGKPVVCANFGAMAEVAAGGGCRMVDTRDPQALHDAIRTLALDPHERDRLAGEARRRDLTTWQSYAHDFAKLLDRELESLPRMGTIYYCIEHTRQFDGNTGIQRVVRGLGRALQEIGCAVVPVTWDAARRSIRTATASDLAHLQRWNGPRADGWRVMAVPARFEPGDWLLMPELTVYPGGPNLEHVRQFSLDSGLRTAWVFYDAIPFKMRDLYNPHQSIAHADYMRAIGRFERVLAISEHSARDLRQFLASIPDRTPEIDRRVLACPLPGEFRESARVTELAAPHDGPLRILSVGSVEPRKNHRRLLEAFELARQRTDRPLELHLVGGCALTGAAADEFRAKVAAIPGVSWLERADDSALRAAYAHCDITVYPSLEEGFGLPILESLWNARPCICRDQGAMAEVAAGGGCLGVDTSDAGALADAISRLAREDDLRSELGRQAVTREFRTWTDYAREVVECLVRERSVGLAPAVAPSAGAAALVAQMPNLVPLPQLSVCITTYNRAPWLALSLQNLVRLVPEPIPGLEIVICDNASSDDTPEVVKPYLSRPDVRYRRNPVNVGMLGNLQATAHAARGRYIWILGDDDLVRPGAIERILGVLREHPELALVYLNYAFTRQDDARAVTDLDRFLADSTPIVAPGQDLFAPVRDISTESENFFTAIYCLVFRRDHALRAYSQYTGGRPFSTMLTCIPTTYHVLHEMMDEPGCWLGEPQVVVNMNVSWSKYAALWILERLPEAFDRAEIQGADPHKVDTWRERNVPGVVHYFREIFENDPAGNIEFFDAARLVSRFKHVEAFRREVPLLKSIYQSARERGAPGTGAELDEVFAAFRGS